MRAIAAGLTDIGRERNHNEDRFLLLPEYHVFVVADGMGGHQSGEVASRMAASTIASFYRGLNGAGASAAADKLSAAVHDANAKIFARADDSRAHRGMGTTVVAAAYRASDQSMHVVHAGDSRAYHIRGDAMRQLTRDHSLLSDALLERPELTESDLAYLPRNVITRALGIAPTVDLDVASCDTQPGDLFLLCSDGLHGLVEDDVIKSIIRQNDVLTDACSRLVDAANRNGGRDNITAVLIRIEEGDSPVSARSPGARSPSVLPPRVSEPPSTEPAPVGYPPPDSTRAGAAGETSDEAGEATPTPSPVEVSASDAERDAVPPPAPSSGNASGKKKKKKR